MGKGARRCYGFSCLVFPGFAITLNHLLRKHTIEIRPLSTDNICICLCPVSRLRLCWCRFSVHLFPVVVSLYIVRSFRSTGILFMWVFTDIVENLRKKSFFSSTPATPATPFPHLTFEIWLIISVLQKRPKNKVFALHRIGVFNPLFTTIQNWIIIQTRQPYYCRGIIEIRIRWVRVPNVLYQRLICCFMRQSMRQRTFCILL